VVEAAVVGIPDEIKGYAVVVFVVVSLENTESTEEIVKGVIALFRSTIGPIATPKAVKVVPDLPKTRSGKIMRRILRKIECNEIDSIGDVSTLANPDCVQQIIDTLNNKITDKELIQNTQQLPIDDWQQFIKINSQ